jgi:hypothetical protein
MRSSHRAPFVAAVATLALAGCGAGTSGGNASPQAVASPSESESAVSAPGAAAPATSSPNPASPTTAASEPPSPAPAPAGLVTYTFPNGHVSLKHPAYWPVELFNAGGTPFVGTATVYDAAGTRQATV